MGLEANVGRGAQILPIGLNLDLVFVTFFFLHKIKYKQHKILPTLCFKFKLKAIVRAGGFKIQIQTQFRNSNSNSISDSN